MKNYLMTMALALIATTKIIFVNVDLKIVLAILLERVLDGEYLIFANNRTKFWASGKRTSHYLLFFLSLLSFLFSFKESLGFFMTLESLKDFPLYLLDII